MRLSTHDRTILLRWADRAVADLAAPPALGRREPAIDWSPLLREALHAYAGREPLRFLAAVIRALPPGLAVDLGPLSHDFCNALLAHLRTAPDAEAQAAVVAAERLLRRGHNGSPDGERGTL